MHTAVSKEGSLDCCLSSSTRAQMLGGTFSKNLTNTEGSEWSLLPEFLNRNTLYAARECPHNEELAG